MKLYKDIQHRKAGKIRLNTKKFGLIAIFYSCSQQQQLGRSMYQQAHSAAVLKRGLFSHRLRYTSACQTRGYSILPQFTQPDSQIVTSSSVLLRIISELAAKKTLLTATVTAAAFLSSFSSSTTTIDRSQHLSCCCCRFSSTMIRGQFWLFPPSSSSSSSIPSKSDWVFSQLDTERGCFIFGPNLNDPCTGSETLGLFPTLNFCTAVLWGHFFLSLLPLAFLPSNPTPSSNSPHFVFGMGTCHGCQRGEYPGETAKHNIFTQIKSLLSFDWCKNLSAQTAKSCCK